MEPPANDGLVGTILDQRYKVLSQLGTGKDGAIYRAEDLQRQYAVALRFLTVERVSSKALVQLKHNAEAATGLAHPNIVRIYALNAPEGGKPYFVVDCVDGAENLEETFARQQKLPEDVCISCFAQICDALDHAHGKGVVHRNLKPSNLMLISAGGGSYMVKVADFGVGRPSELAESRSKHKHQAANVSYMSPEECNGKPLDGRSDIYSAGCLLFHALTGRPPFSGANPFETMSKHTSEQPPDLNVLVPGLKYGAQLQSILARALAKAPEQRYQSALQMSHDLNLLYEVSPAEWNERAFAKRPPTSEGSAVIPKDAEPDRSPRVDFVKPLAILIGLAVVIAVPVGVFVLASLADADIPGMTKYKLVVQEKFLAPDDPRVVKNLKVMMDYYKQHVMYADAYACKEKLDRLTGKVTTEKTE